MRRGQKTSVEQMVLKLRQIEVQTAQGKSLALARKEAEISEQSYYRWREEYRDLQVDQARKMKDLERGHTRLRRLAARACYRLNGLRRLGFSCFRARRCDAVGRAVG